MLKLMRAPAKYVQGKDAFLDNPILKIIGKKGSVAEEYADENKIRFIELK